MTTEELDDLLDERDENSFECAWIDLNARVSHVKSHTDCKDLFIKVSNATNHHEICSYIADDMVLMNKAETLKLDSKFLDYLQQSYKQGIVPSKWNG